MSDYHIEFIENASKIIDFKGKVILDIGCGDGTVVKKIAKEYKPKKIIGIDKCLKSWWNIENCKGDNWEIIDGDAMDIPFEDNSFDIVLSVATFEHIKNLDITLQNIKRVLKPYGKFYTEFAPIWTSVLGHHYKFWSADYIDLLPPWAHLYMSKEEMLKYLIEKGESVDKAEDICYKVYDSEEISSLTSNKLTRRDITNSIINSGLWIKSFYECIAFSRKCWMGDTKSELTDEIKARIKQSCDDKNYNINDIGVIGYVCLLEKYGSI